MCYRKNSKNSFLTWTNENIHTTFISIQYSPSSRIFKLHILCFIFQYKNPFFKLPLSHKKNINYIWYYNDNTLMEVTSGPLRRTPNKVVSQTEQHLFQETSNWYYSFWMNFKASTSNGGAKEGRFLYSQLLLLLVCLTQASE